MVAATRCGKLLAPIRPNAIELNVTAVTASATLVQTLNQGLRANTLAVKAATRAVRTASCGTWRKTRMEPTRNTVETVISYRPSSNETGKSSATVVRMMKTASGTRNRLRSPPG